jgi:hypothetical protein
MVVGISTTATATATATAIATATADRSLQRFCLQLSFAHRLTHQLQLVVVLAPALLL